MDSNKLMRSPHTAFVLASDYVTGSEDSFYVANLLTSELAILQGPSAVIWEILEEATSTHALISEITEIYGVTREVVSGSVLAFLDSMEAQGLIQRVETGETSSETLGSEG